MAGIQKAPNEKELEALRKVFLKAETDIINQIAYLRSVGNVDYHAVAALERVQKILEKMQDDALKYIPKMVEKQFYVRVPEARQMLEPIEKHIAGYSNAGALTGEQHLIIDKLVSQLTAEIMDASSTTMSTLQNVLIGRTENDVFRRIGLENVASMQAKGVGARVSIDEFVSILLREGITAFVDKAGRNWSLHTYANMCCRTTSRQAEVLAVLTADPEHDLYKISSHGTTCPICAPFEGRVYSRSGTSDIYPPLATAFGKIDPSGPNDLSNTYLNIHPNCLHVLTAWTDEGLDEEELKKIQAFSNPKTNPFNIDPRTKKQIEAYRKKEKARAKWLSDYRQWEHYRMVLGDEVPKTFETFQKHKIMNDEKYKKWKEIYVISTRDYDIIKKKLFDNSLKLTLNKGAQNKHILSSKGYIEGRSYIYGNLDEAQQIVNKYAGSGEPKFDKKGSWVNKEVITTDKPIGVDINPNTGLKQETNRLVIHYSKKGTHIVPARRKES